MAAKQFIKDLKENDIVVSPFVVRVKTLGNTRSGTPFLSVRLGDRTGEVEGRVWERAVEFNGIFNQGDVVGVRARVERYRDHLQLNITEIERLDPEEMDSDQFLPRTPEDPERLWRKLKELVAGVQNPHLLRLLQRFLTDHTFARQMKQAPAAKSMHHAYLGGLLEHTVSVTTLLGRLCDHYPSLNRDLLVTAGILHDIGKLDEFSYDLQVDYTDAGRLLGHVVLAVQRVAEEIEQIKGFPTTLSVLLQHLILSHHGEHEFGAVKRPKTPEAFALHYADDLDAKMNHLAGLLEAEGNIPSHWTTFQRAYGRFIYKGGTEEESSPDHRAGAERDITGPVNYSLLDQLPVFPDEEEPE